MENKYLADLITEHCNYDIFVAQPNCQIPSNLALAVFPEPTLQDVNQAFASPDYDPLNKGKKKFLIRLMSHILPFEVLEDFKQASFKAVFTLNREIRRKSDKTIDLRVSMMNAHHISYIIL